MKNPLPYIPPPVGIPILCQPYHFSDARLAVLFFDSHASALNKLLDTYINEPSGGRYQYRSVGVDGKALTVMVMAQMTADARNTDGRDFGKERYSELSFWILCYDHKALKKAEFRPALFIPFIFPDSFSAIATGREMFGFDKQLASFSYPGGKLDLLNPAFTATTRAFKTLGPDSVAQPYDFISVPGGSTDAPTDGSWTQSSFATSSIVKHFLGKRWTDSVTEEELGSITNDFLDDCQAIFLKQFPSIENARVAEARSITSAPFQLLKFRAGFPYLHGLALKTFDVEFARLASLPIVAQLGLTPESSTSEADVVAARGFWVDVDFSLETGKTLARIPPAKQKIAVLGGGIGSLSAVYGITQDPDWQQKYDITVYQLGWRLGGKGASGRNREMADRVEEHGLHIWFGYYENAFRLIQSCYGELGRPPNVPLATWDQAFKPHNHIVVEELVSGRWVHWPLTFAPNTQVPGKGEVPSDSPVRFFGELSALLAMMHGEVVQHIQEFGTVGRHMTETLSARGRELEQGSLVGKLFDAVAKPAVAAVEEVIEGDLLRMLNRFESMLQSFSDRNQDLQALVDKVDDVVERWLGILKELRVLLEQLIEPFAEAVDSIRRLWILADLGLAIATGILLDGVLIHGYSAINKYDFTAWLIRNGASKNAANSVIVRAFYDLYLAFPNGQSTVISDKNEGDSGAAIGGNCSAGELLHSYILVTLCYKGSIMWKMQAGMGDTVMTPIYQVLKQRGVRFEFFQKVTNLHLSTDQRIGAIDLDVQATVKPNVGEYNPLYDVKGLPCWPSAPLYEQLEQGRELREQQIDLESSWSPWQPVAKKTLRLGEDFDLVVLGISVAALPYITSELSAASPQWKSMLDHATTSQTQAMQLWLNVNLEETGWPLPSPVLDAYAEPFNTWAVMNQTLNKESWPQNALPFSIAYFCNNMKDANPIPPFSDHGFPARERQRVKEDARAWLERYTGHLWPFATQPKSAALDWSKLVDLENRSGVARLDGQYFRANIDPTERYVCNAANTNQYRLKAGGSGFENLYLAGDWVDNGSLNLGNVESTVISGLQAARALTGYPVEIVRD